MAERKGVTPARRLLAQPLPAQPLLAQPLLVHRAFYLGPVFRRAADRHGAVFVTLDRPLDVDPSLGVDLSYPMLADVVEELSGRLWEAGRRPSEQVAVHKTAPVGNPALHQPAPGDTERFLRAACERAGVEFVWDARVTDVRSTATGVRITAGDGRVWTGEYAIAADGARSTLRRSLGIAMEGSHGKGFHVVVDAADIPGAELPLERVFHYEHPAVGGRSVMRVPFTGGFQVDLQCRDDDREEEYGTAEAVRRWLPSVVGYGYAERVLWVSTYRFLRKVAASSTDPHGRVLLVGESAHLFPPFGARGMNSGIADAAAAAHAVAAAAAHAVAAAAAHAVAAAEGAVAAGAAGAVAEFAAVRRAAALFNSAAAGEALDHLRTRRRIVRVKQRAAAALAPVPPWCGSWLEHAPYGPRGGAPVVAGGKY